VSAPPSSSRAGPLSMSRDLGVRTVASMNRDQALICCVDEDRSLRSFPFRNVCLMFKTEPISSRDQRGAPVLRAVDSFFRALLRRILLVASVPSSQAETGSPQRPSEI
jgi:hypothetical protein